MSATRRFTLLCQPRGRQPLLAVNTSEMPQDFTFVEGWNLSAANATIFTLVADKCAMTVDVSMYFDAIDTSELYSVESPPTVLNADGFAQSNLTMDNVYETIVVLTLTSDCASGVSGYLYFSQRGHYFANLSTETPMCTLDVKMLVEDQLPVSVYLFPYRPSNEVCDGQEVEVQLTGYYYNLSTEITVAPPTDVPTAQPTAHPTAHPTAQPTAEPTAQPSTPVPETMSPEDGSGSGSSGLAKGVVAAIVVVSSLVAVAGAAGVYFYCKKVRGNAHIEEQTELILKNLSFLVFTLEMCATRAHTTHTHTHPHTVNLFK